MLVNNNFKNKIASYFYDKAFNVYTKVTSVGVEGDVQTNVSLYNSYYGNVQYNTNERVQKDYGIKDNIDLIITTSSATDVSLDNYVEYNGIYFVVKHVLKFDSHINLLCEKTQLRFDNE